jgi:phosphoribosylcarboxyaminoimidazole (NCAIR) mutase
MQAFDEHAHTRDVDTDTACEGFLAEFREMVNALLDRPVFGSKPKGYQSTSTGSKVSIPREICLPAGDIT